jgi:hypothetical protein
MSALRGARRRQYLEKAASAPLTADSISFATCSHGTVFVRLHDRNGRIFALAPIALQDTVDVGLGFARAVADANERAAPIDRRVH